MVWVIYSKMNEPSFITNLVEIFEKLPGVGYKTAVRYAYHIVEKYNLQDINKACETLQNTFKCIKKCEKCGMYTTNNICEICQNSLRDQTKILVVKDQKDLLNIEKTGQYNGLYHVLGGLISSLYGNDLTKINISNLEKRVFESPIKEVIIATSLSPAGDITALYLEKILSQKEGLNISRIGYGLPAGSDLEYADELTIKRALEYRIQRNK